MKKVTITRLFSGFNNVEDSYVMGDKERLGDASASEYYLPEGYTIKNGEILNPNGWVCEVIYHPEGPQLVPYLDFSNEFGMPILKKV